MFLCGRKKCVRDTIGRSVKYRSMLDFSRSNPVHSVKMEKNNNIHTKEICWLLWVYSSEDLKTLMLATHLFSWQKVLTKLTSYKIECDIFLAVYFVSYFLNFIFHILHLASKEKSKVKYICCVFKTV